MMPALHNYVTTDPTAFIGQRKHLHIVYEMCKKVNYRDCQFVSDAATTGPMKSLSKFMKRLVLFDRIRNLADITVHSLCKPKQIC